MGPPPRRFEKYVLQRELDGDARHEVFLAEHENGDEAILAFVNLDDAAAADIREDLARTSKLKHPAILPVTAMIESDGRRALVHPAVNGRTLARLAEQLESDGEWMADVAIFHVGQQIAAALATAQRSKPPVVHGCLTPERVIVTWEGKVQLLGLGSAAALPAVPAPPWLGLAAPEIRAGEPVTPEANTYALGALLWWLVTKMKPSSEGTPEALDDLRGDLSAIIRKAIERAVNADPAQRGKASMIAGALMREAKTGRDELKWNMEVFQALDRFDDVLPSSAAFPTSFPPAASSHPAPSGHPPLSDPPEEPPPEKLAPAKKEKPNKKVQPPRPAPPRLTRDKPPKPTEKRDKDPIAKLLDGSSSDDAGAKPRPGMFDVWASDSEPPDSDPTRRVSKVELEEQGLRKQRTTHVGTLEEIERALDEEEAETKRSRQTSPDIDIAIDADEDDAEEEAREAMFPKADTEPPTSDDEPTKRVPLGVLKAQAEARMARRAAEAAGRPVLLGSAADPAARMTPTPGTPVHAPPPRPPIASTGERSGPSLSFTLVIAITAIAAFSAGIFVVRGWGDDAPEPQPPTTTSSTAIASPPAPTTEATPSAAATTQPSAKPTAQPSAEPSAAPSAAPSAEPSAQASAEPPDELPTPLYKHGLLRVNAPKAGATVYFKGKPVGKVGEILMVPCGAGFVRLGDDPLTKWYNDGRVVAIPCKKELAEVAMTVKPAFR